MKSMAMEFSSPVCCSRTSTTVRPAPLAVAPPTRDPTDYQGVLVGRARGSQTRERDGLRSATVCHGIACARRPLSWSGGPRHDSRVSSPKPGAAIAEPGTDIASSPRPILARPVSAVRPTPFHRRATIASAYNVDGRQPPAIETPSPDTAHGRSRTARCVPLRALEGRPPGALGPPVSVIASVAFA